MGFFFIFLGIYLVYVWVFGRVMVIFILYLLVWLLIFGLDFKKDLWVRSWCVWLFRNGDDRWDSSKMELCCCVVYIERIERFIDIVLLEFKVCIGRFVRWCRLVLFFVVVLIERIVVVWFVWRFYWVVMEGGVVLYCIFWIDCLFGNLWEFW